MTGAIPPEPPEEAEPREPPRKQTGQKMMIVGGVWLLLSFPMCAVGLGGGGSLFIVLGFAGLLLGPVLILVGLLPGPGSR